MYDDFSWAQAEQALCKVTGEGAGWEKGDSCLLVLIMYTSRSRFDSALSISGHVLRPLSRLGLALQFALSDTTSPFCVSSSLYTQRSWCAFFPTLLTAYGVTARLAIRFTFPGWGRDKTRGQMDGWMVLGEGLTMAPARWCLSVRGPSI